MSPTPDPTVEEAVRRAVRDEFDGVLPHLVTALKRDRAFDALTERLHVAERRLDSRRERPVVLALLAALHRLRHLDFDPDVKASLDAELVRILADAGFQETGTAGETFDPALHDAVDGRLAGGEGVVLEVLASGLRSFGDVLVRAQVTTAPALELSTTHRTDKEA